MSGIETNNDNDLTRSPWTEQDSGHKKYVFGKSEYTLSCIQHTLCTMPLVNDYKKKNYVGHTNAVVCNANGMGHVLC